MAKMTELAIGDFFYGKDVDVKQAISNSNNNIVNMRFILTNCQPESHYNNLQEIDKIARIDCSRQNQIQSEIETFNSIDIYTGTKVRNLSELVANNVSMKNVKLYGSGLVIESKKENHVLISRNSTQVYHWLDRFKLIKGLSDVPSEVVKHLRGKEKIGLTYEFKRIIKPTNKQSKGDSVFYCNFSDYTTIGIISENYSPEWQVSDIKSIDTRIPPKIDFGNKSKAQLTIIFKKDVDDLCIEIDAEEAYFLQKLWYYTGLDNSEVKKLITNNHLDLPINKELPTEPPESIKKLNKQDTLIESQFEDRKYPHYGVDSRYIYTQYATQIPHQLYPSQSINNSYYSEEFNRNLSQIDTITNQGNWSITNSNQSLKVDLQEETLIKEIQALRVSIRNSNYDTQLKCSIELVAIFQEIQENALKRMQYNVNNYNYNSNNDINFMKKNDQSMYNANYPGNQKNMYTQPLQQSGYDTSSNYLNFAQRGQIQSGPIATSSIRHYSESYTDAKNDNYRQYS